MKKPTGYAPVGFCFVSWMDAKRKTAYRKVLYNFSIHLKNPDIPEDASAIKIGQYAAVVAYALHNFALASANDFIDFDEDVFWQALDYWDGRFPSRGFAGFRRMFEWDLLEG